MITIRTLALAIAVAVSAAASTAQAATGQYRVEAGETVSINLNVCMGGAKVNIAGTGRTDLDFVIRNLRGRVVHEDNDDTDYTEVDLTSRRGSCETFELEVHNAGNRNSGFVVIMN
jgi:hypothetical protein